MGGLSCMNTFVCTLVYAFMSTTSTNGNLTLKASHYVWQKSLFYIILIILTQCYVLSDIQGTRCASFLFPTTHSTHVVLLVDNQPLVHEDGIQCIYEHQHGSITLCIPHRLSFTLLIMSLEGFVYRIAKFLTQVRTCINQNGMALFLSHFGSCQKS